MVAAVLSATAGAASTSRSSETGASSPQITAGAATLKRIDPAALRTLVAETARALMVPGALVLLRTPQGEFTASYGSTTLEAVRPPTADTHFRIASNTKTMTAAVIMLLAQDGALALDDRVSTYVADVPNGEQIRIAELLAMRSGLYNYTDAPELWASLDRQPARAWLPTDVLAMAFARPANAPPDTTYEYNNTNYALLGLIAERAAGKPLAQLMRDRLFAPLGMRHTVLPAGADDTIPDPAARGYGYGGTAMVLSDASSYSAAVHSAARAGTLSPTDYTGLNPSFATAAGGAISTANDLAVWIRALVGGEVLDAEQQRRWHDAVRPQDPSRPRGQEYGYGISRLRWGPNTVYFHGGETPGYNSKIAYDPANRMTLVVWTNMAVSLDGQQPANTLMINILDQIYALSPLATPTGARGRSRGPLLVDARIVAGTAVRGPDVRPAGRVLIDEVEEDRRVRRDVAAHVVQCASGAGGVTSRVRARAVSA
jgi:D-alanyl-D-alanine carboxypeptidase